MRDPSLCIWKNQSTPEACWHENWPISIPNITEADVIALLVKDKSDSGRV